MLLLLRILGFPGLVLPVLRVCPFCAMRWTADLLMPSESATLRHDSPPLMRSKILHRIGVTISPFGRVFIGVSGILDVYLLCFILSKYILCFVVTLF